jgi:hypothetical protein
MEDGKLFRVIIISISLLFASVAQSGTNSYVKETEGAFLNFPTPTTLGENELWSAPSMAWNHIQYLRFSLRKEEKNLHQSAVYHALNNTRDGETVSWYSKKRLVKGKVRVIHSFRTSDGYCRVYQSLILVNTVQRHMTNNACKNPTGVWAFLK